MSDTPHDPHRRPHEKSMADPFMEFDLPAQVHSLTSETTWSTGHNARTLVKYDDLRVVLIAVKAGQLVPEHKTEGRVSIHVLSGHAHVRASGRTFDLRQGGLLALDRGIAHDVEAFEDSALLLTIAWPGRSASAGAL
jgi:quercetin dioxygenase-like cupin family protein